MTITVPGIYDGLPADQYHAHPALSSSGARRLLPPSCPALFHYEQTNPLEPSRDMEFGSVAHELLLGNGNGFVVLEYDSYRTKAAQEEAKAAREKGLAPILMHEYRVAQAMVAVVRRHPIAGKLFAAGKSEQSLFWTDADTGVQRRARVDHLRPLRNRLAIVDYKTADSVAPDKIGKHSWDYGYAQQAEWYIDGATALDLGRDPAFIVVSQMKQPPYLVTVGQYDEMSRAIARELNRRAIQIYARCMETGVWPGFADDITTLSLPGWVQNQWMKDML